jgi:hypothetical protein
VQKRKLIGYSRGPEDGGTEKRVNRCGRRVTWNLWEQLLKELENSCNGSCPEFYDVILEINLTGVRFVSDVGTE